MSHVDPNCQHGMLRRGCDLCEMIVQNADLRARVAKQAALLADLRDAIDSGDRFSYVSGPLRALLDAAIGDAGNKGGSRDV